MNKETVHFLVGQMKHKDEEKDTILLQKIKKSDMEGMMESIKENFRSFHDVIKEPLAYIIRKTITVQIMGNYPMYASLDDEMIAMILHLPPDKNKLLSEKDIQKVQAGTAMDKIDNPIVYDIMDQICKVTDLCPYVKQHKSKRDGRRAFYIIQSRWLGPKHVNAKVSEAEMTLHMPIYDGENKAWNWEKYVAHHVN